MPRKAVKSSAAKPSSSQKAGGKRKRSVSADSSKPVPGLGPNKRITRSVTRRLQQEMADKMVAQNVPSPDPVQAEEGHLPSPDPVQAEETQPKEASGGYVKSRFIFRGPAESPPDDYFNATENDEENQRWRGNWLNGKLWEGDFIHIAWGHADHYIGILAHRLAALSMGWEALKPADQKYLSSWAANAKGHMDKLTGNKELLEAWIWHILWDRLFSPECDDKWHGEQWAAYGKICSYLRGRTTRIDNSFTRCFHNWRWSTTHMLSAMHGSHVDPAWLCTILRGELSGLFKYSDPDRFDEDLLNAAEAAIRLDKYIQGCKHDITLFMAHPETGTSFGFRCDARGSKLMQTWEQEQDPRDRAYDDPAGSLVDFIQRPGVKTYGKQEVCPVPLWVKSHEEEVYVGAYDQVGALQIPMRAVAAVSVAATTRKPCSGSRVWLRREEEEEDQEEQEEENKKKKDKKETGKEMKKRMTTKR
ncbi:uncharacterized protein E0L32_012120 [Thyridium curvatum]|uniref:Uncharacterized protein n=1 Tax=Thyridium curvatum TaxID=1093900 RepID=A0A507BE36_9PEZI|nr:uncharacterized protein E0L32_012120 [Thyridium curvatum]TPX17586.1 hypothetical protein E0L32_012120 [Thyridium curvatum]